MWRVIQSQFFALKPLLSHFYRPRNASKIEALSALGSPFPDRAPDAPEFMDPNDAQRAALIYEGTSETQRLVISARVLQNR